jgi:hypothetical protein
MKARQMIGELMKKVASTDHGSVLSAGSSALVVDENGSLSLLLADYDDDAPVPVLVQLLAAVALRSEDEDWVAETLSVFDEVSKS